MRRWRAEVAHASADDALWVECVDMERIVVWIPAEGGRSMARCKAPWRKHRRRMPKCAAGWRMISRTSRWLPMRRLVLCCMSWGWKRRRCWIDVPTSRLLRWRISASSDCRSMARCDAPWRKRRRRIPRFTFGWRMFSRRSWWLVMRRSVLCHRSCSWRRRSCWTLVSTSRLWSCRGTSGRYGQGGGAQRGY